MQTNLVGVYRALVTSISDPTNSKKIRTQCPQVAGSAELRWAEPVNPNEPVPDVGSTVWVAFSGGDVTKPMYFNNKVNPAPVIGSTSYILLANDFPSTNTTLTTVPGFSFSVAANATYVFDGLLTYNGQTFAAGPGDLKLDWTVPASSVFRWVRNGYISNSTNQTDTIETDESTIRVLGTFGSSTNISASLRGSIATAGTSGTVQLRAAQNSATATATILKSTSWLRVTRVS